MSIFRQATLRPARMMVLSLRTLAFFAAGIATGGADSTLKGEHCVREVTAPPPAQKRFNLLTQLRKRLVRQGKLPNSAHIGAWIGIGFWGPLYKKYRKGIP